MKKTTLIFAMTVISPFGGGSHLRRSILRGSASLFFMSRRDKIYHVPTGRFLGGWAYVFLPISDP